MSLGAPLPGLWRRAAAAAEPRADLPILVVVELTGGNDGLNTVIPHADDIYHKSRPTLRIEPDKVLKLDDRVGPAPGPEGAAPALGVGRPGGDSGGRLSEPEPLALRSMEIWQTGALGPAPPAGWLGRAADVDPALRLCHVGPQSVPLAVRGRKAMPQALASLADYPSRARCRAWPMPPRRPTPAIPCWTQVRRQFAAARDLSDRLAAIPDRPEAIRRVARHARGPAGDDPPPDRGRLPAAGSTTRPRTGFDTHAAQRFSHQDLLRTGLAGRGRVPRRA